MVVNKFLSIFMFSGDITVPYVCGNQRQKLSILKNKFTKSIHFSTYVKQVESGVGSGFGTINPDPGRTWVKVPDLLSRLK
jgi:hypothetical protein